MSGIARKNPYVRFFINYRNVQSCCESLLNYYTVRKHQDAALPVEKLIDKYWIATYRGCIHESESLCPKPHLIEFDKYVKGEYNDLFLELYGFPKTQENYEIMRRVLDIKDNTCGEHTLRLEVPPQILRGCNVLWERVQAACKHSWVDEEVLGSVSYAGLNNNYPNMENMLHQKLFGCSMCQTFTALFPFEWILNLYPIEHIVEIGTARGGLSLYLQQQAAVRNIGYRTYDAIDRRHDGLNYESETVAVRNVELLEPHFKKMNVFEDKTIEEIRSIIANHRVFMYCDNGNKPRELKTYMPFLKQGDVIGVHDWNNQFEIEALVRDLSLKVIFEEFCQTYKTKQRFWVKTA